MRNLLNFHRTTQKSEIFTLMGSSMDTSICPKYIRFELRKYWGVMFYETEQWCKIWIKMAWGIGWTFIRALKSLKNCTLTFLSKVYISFSQKMSEKLFVMTLKSDSKFKEKLTRSLKNDMRTLVNFHESSWKSTNLHFDVFLLSKAYKYLDEKVQKSYVSWHWRVMQSLRKNWLLVPKMTLEIWWIFRWGEASLKIFTLMCYLCQRYIKFQLKKYIRVITQHWKVIQTLKKNWRFT